MRSTSVSIFRLSRRSAHGRPRLPALARGHGLPAEEAVCSACWQQRAAHPDRSSRRRTPDADAYASGRRFPWRKTPNLRRNPAAGRRPAAGAAAAGEIAADTFVPASQRCDPDSASSAAGWRPTPKARPRTAAGPCGWRRINGTHPTCDVTSAPAWRQRPAMMRRRGHRLRPARIRHGSGPMETRRIMAARVIRFNTVLNCQGGAAGRRLHPARRQGLFQDLRRQQPGVRRARWRLRGSCRRASATEGRERRRQRSAVHDEDLGMQRN